MTEATEHTHTHLLDSPHLLTMTLNFRGHFDSLIVLLVQYYVTREKNSMNFPYLNILYIEFYIDFSLVLSCQFQTGQNHKGDHINHHPHQETFESEGGAIIAINNHIGY